MNIPEDSIGGSHFVVTGANGLLGRAVCEKLISRGGYVSAWDVDFTGSRPEEFTAGRYLSIECDVSSGESVAHAVASSVREFGSINGLMNNAATKTGDLGKFFEETLSYELPTWHEVLATNLTGMFLVARAIIPEMTNEASIVQTASIYGASMGPDLRIYEGSEYLGQQISSPVSYTVSKAGVQGLTVHLATEFGGSGIRVNTLTPGGIRSGQNEVFRRKYSSRVPLGRMAEVDEIANVAIFLLSQHSSYMTGQNIFVDGGLSAW